MNGFALPFPYSDRAPFPHSRAPDHRPNRRQFKATATLLPIYQQTDSRIPQGEYTAGILCKAPAPEGGDVQEPTWANYRRQVVTFGLDGKSYRNQARITFAVPDDDQTPCKCIGIFKDDRLYAYGRLESEVGMPVGLEGLRVVNIEPGSLKFAAARAN